MVITDTEAKKTSKLRELTRNQASEGSYSTPVDIEQSVLNTKKPLTISTQEDLNDSVIIIDNPTSLKARQDDLKEKSKSVKSFDNDMASVAPYKISSNVDIVEVVESDDESEESVIIIDLVKNSSIIDLVSDSEDECNSNSLTLPSFSAISSSTSSGSSASSKPSLSRKRSFNSGNHGFIAKRRKLEINASRRVYENRGQQPMSDVAMTRISNNESGAVQLPSTSALQNIPSARKKNSLGNTSSSSNVLCPINNQNVLSRTEFNRPVMSSTYPRPSVFRGNIGNFRPTESRSFAGTSNSQTVRSVMNIRSFQPPKSRFIPAVRRPSMWKNVAFVQSILSRNTISRLVKPFKFSSPFGWAMKVGRWFTTSIRNQFSDRRNVNVGVMTLQERKKRWRKARKVLQRRRQQLRRQRPQQQRQQHDNTNENTNDPEHLDTMSHVVFVDLDNWTSFFHRLPYRLPPRTFVWGFYGGATVWKEPVDVDTYADMKVRRAVKIHKKCGNRKDAADFTICMQIGRMDERLPTSVSFTVVSGDRGFEELERQYAEKARRVVVIDPHNHSERELCALLKSVGQL